MIAKIKKNQFGNIAKMIDADSYLAIELGNDSSKTISTIAANFRVPAGETLVSKPFLQGAVIVIRAAADSLNLKTDFINLVDTQNLEYLKFFNGYDGFSDNVYITAEKNSKISIVLVAPYLQADPATQAAAFGSLTVCGSLGEDKHQFELV